MAIPIDEVHAESRNRLLDFYRNAMGPWPPWSRPLHRIGREIDDFILRLCVGNGRVLSQHQAFFRCLGCYKVRTTRGLIRNGGRCKCGGIGVNDATGAINTVRAILLLIARR